MGVVEQDCTAGPHDPVHLVEIVDLLDVVDHTGHIEFVRDVRLDDGQRR